MLTMGGSAEGVCLFVPASAAVPRAGFMPLSKFGFNTGLVFFFFCLDFFLFWFVYGTCWRFLWFSRDSLR